jgi:hypothetical protein
MTSCRSFRDRVALWAGGDLHPSEASDLQRHLAACPDCGERLQEMQRAIGILGHADPEPTFVEQPRSLWPEVSRRINASISAPHVPIYRRKWVLSTAAACLLVLVAWIAWPRGPVPQGKPDPRGASHPGLIESSTEEDAPSVRPQSHSRSLMESGAGDATQF